MTQGSTMDVRVGLLVVLILAGNWFSDARNMASLDLSGREDGRGLGNINVCTLCEGFVGMALDYLNDDNNQDEVLRTLHSFCIQMHQWAIQCKILVDSYTTLFFTEVSLVKPRGLCNTVGMCRNPKISSMAVKENKYTVCRKTVDGVIHKLKDPETELGIIETLMKTCNSVKKYKNECKRMVLEFGHVFLIDAGKFIEGLDICTRFHTYNKTQQVIAPETYETMTTY